MLRGNYIRQSQLMWKGSVVIGIGDSLLGVNAYMDRFNRRRTGACGKGIVAIETEDIFLRASMYVDRTKAGTHGEKTVVIGRNDALLELEYVDRGWGHQNRQ